MKKADQAGESSREIKLSPYISCINLNSLGNSKIYVKKRPKKHLVFFRPQKFQISYPSSKIKLFFQGNIWVTLNEKKGAQLLTQKCIEFMLLHLHCKKNHLFPKNLLTDLVTENAVKDFLISLRTRLTSGGLEPVLNNTLNYVQHRIISSFL